MLRLAIVCMLVSVAYAAHHLGDHKWDRPGLGLAFFEGNGFNGVVALLQNGSQLRLDFRRLNVTVTGNYAVDIHSLPISIGKYDSPCERTGPLFNPVKNASTPYGDLSALGNFMLTTTSQTYTVNVPLAAIGTSGYLGRSLVIHDPSKNDALVACANIKHASDVMMSQCGSTMADDAQDTLEGVFNGRVAGRITFKSLRGMQRENATSIVAHLFYTDGTNTTEGHYWHAHANPVTGDGCSSVGAVAQDFSAEAGDLLNIGATSMGTQGRQVKSTYLSMRFMNLRGKSVAIHQLRSGGPGPILACANITMVHKRTFTADFGTDGKVMISQDNRFSSSQVNLQLTRTPLSVMVNNFKAPARGSAGCATNAAGGVFNPFNKSMSMNQSRMMKPSRDHPTGDLGSKTGRKMTTMKCDDSLSLFGPNSVARRSVSLMTSSGRKCANLTESLSAGDRMMKAKAIFMGSGSSMGAMYMEQVVRADGSMGITTISSNGLRNKDNSMTMNHNYHVHVNRKGYQNSSAACGSAFAAGHYNPFSVHTNMTYSSDCNPDNQLRCETGDTSAKSGTINMDNGQVLRQDSFMPLMGKYSVMGRSLVIHAQNQGRPRVACANIIPMTATDVQIGVKTNRLRGGWFNSSRFAMMVKQSSSMASGVDVLYPTSYNDTISGCTYISAAIDGANSETVASRLSRADLGTEFSQRETECTDGVSFASVSPSSASMLSHTVSLIVLMCTIVLLF